tara:strand:- start:75 stop:422 length:348 start_codon:yes stop_codon:yes gene_type:complete
MSKKLTNKFLIKAYYNLLLVREIKKNTFEDFSNSTYQLEDYAELAQQDLKELDECISAFKSMVDDVSDEAYFLNTSIIHLLEEDPYYKIIQLVYESEEKLNQFKPSKKINKKLMN